MGTREAVIVDAVRTPVGSRNGQLAHWHPTDLTARVPSHRSPAPNAPIAVQMAKDAALASQEAGLATGLGTSDATSSSPCRQTTVARA